MAEIGAYYITILPSMNSFTKAMNRELGTAGKVGGQTWLDAFKGSAVGTALGNLAVRAGDMLASGMDRGIQRLDTLSNFPKVMENLGFKSEDAAKSIKLITDHLDGLPTATDDVVRLTQSIADSTGDLDLATRAALGFNDMLLAGGASTAEMTTATEIFNRILGKQNATVNQWASLQAVMPAQLSMVAEEMLGAGHSSEELRDALNNGVVSWDDFLGAIAKLDEEGSDHIASFDEQARSMTGGIGTAIENVGNRISKGWAAIFEAIGREDIAGTIDRMSTGVKEGMEAIAGWITDFKDKVADTKIGENLEKIFTAISDAVKDAGDAVGSVIPDMTDALVNIIDKCLQWIVDNGDAIAMALSGIAGAIAAFAAYQAAVAVLDGVALAMAAIQAAVTAGEILGVMGGLGAAFGTIAAAGGPLAGIITGIGAALSFLAANPIVLVVGAIGALVAALAYFFTQTEEGKAMLQAIIDWVMDIPNKWAQFTADLQKWNEDIRKAVLEKWEAIKKGIGDVMQAVQKFIEDPFGHIKQFLNDTLTNIENTFGVKLDGVRTVVNTVFDFIKTHIEDRINAVKYVIDNTLKVIQQIFSGDFEGAKNTVFGVFDDIKRGIEDKLNAAKNIVGNIIDGIKNLFNFNWELPAPKLPHIDWHWEDIGGVLSLPVFDGISWYGKGGVFDTATIIGIGEKGKEAALPLNDQTYREIARGISGEMGTGPSVLVTGNTWVIREEADIDRIADAISRKVERERLAVA